MNLPGLSSFARPIRLWIMRMGLLLAVFLLPAAPARALQPLDAFLASAPTRSPDALEAQASLAQQQAQADLALGRVLPGVTARASITRNQYDSYFNVPPPGSRITIVPLIQRDAFATLTVPLIDLAGFERTAAAKTFANAADRQLAAAQLQVQAQVAQDYYQLVANLALGTAAQQALAVSRESLRLAKSRYDAGSGPVLDVDRATADVEQQTQQVAVTGLQVALAARALESASGLTPDASSTVPLDDDLHAEPALASLISEVDSLPAVVAAKESTRAAEQQASAQRFAFLPTLAGSFSERGTSSSGFTGHNWTWQALLFLNWQLDFTVPATLHVQDALADAARARELRARLFARDAIHRQWETVSASIARSRSARAGRTAAAHAAEQARDRYQAGAITQLELLQAQRDLFSADVSRIQADADLINARAQLKLAAGKSLLEQTGRGVQ